ncbi:MAG: nucleotidyltransferase domain-containing protein [Candidatus Omnitrophica bacterium]|nr:nucleotidyltransferase domain-containing protein [Candidatus Omnitrophota bacterium]
MINVLPAHLVTVRRILAQHVPGYEVRAFGSRITDTIKNYSDLDLAIVGREPLADGVLSLLKENFQESDLPFRVDVLDWHEISEEFRQVINKKYEIIQLSQ